MIPNRWAIRLKITWLSHFQGCSFSNWEKLMLSEELQFQKYSDTIMVAEVPPSGTRVQCIHISFRAAWSVHINELFCVIASLIFHLHGEPCAFYTARKQNNCAELFKGAITKSRLWNQHNRDWFCPLKASQINCLLGGVADLVTRELSTATLMI